MLVFSRAQLVPGVILGVVLGLAIGVGAYTFVYARGYSYMTDNAEACVNCHIMQDQFSGWVKSSHRAVAVCNDCHTPHTVVAKYMTKARNGFWHSYYFTFGGYPDPLRITPRNHAVTEGACRFCHAELTASIDAAGSDAHATVSCTSCHETVGHLE